MDSRTLIAVVLMVLIYMYFVAPPPQPPVATNTIVTSSVNAPTPQAAKPQPTEASLGANSALSEKILWLENSKIKVEIDALGGVRSIVLNDYGYGPSEKSGLKYQFGPQALNRTDISVSLGPIQWNLKEQSKTSIRLEGVAQSVKVVREIQLAEDVYFLSVRNSIKNESSSIVNAGAKIYLQRTAPKQDAPGFFQKLFMLGEQPEQVVAYTDGGVFTEFIGQSPSVVEKSTSVLWSGIAQKYFFEGIVPTDVAIRKVTFTEPALQTSLQEIELSEKQIGPGESSTYSYNFYLGPKDITELAKAGGELSKVVDYGDWLGPIARVLLAIMHFFYGLIANYGVAIILLTILVKMALFPLAFKAAVSMRKLQLITPKMKEIRDRYKDDKYRMNAEVMALYKTEKVNPVGGCLPILIQMPVFFALYRVFAVSIELRHAPFFGWISDLSAHDRFFVTPVLMTACMWYQQKLTPMPTADDDNEAVRMQRAMLKWMPLFFGAIMIFLPSGLTLYMLINAVISIFQQVWLNKHLSLKFPLPNATQSRVGSK